jgi:hypothetical protein
MFTIRPPSLRSDFVTYGASFSLTLERGRTVTGAVRDKTSGAPLVDVWVGPGLHAISAPETVRFPYASDARGQFAIESRSEQIVLAVPKPGQPYYLAWGRVDDAGRVVVDCPQGVPFRLALRDEAGRLIETCGSATETEGRKLGRKCPECVFRIRRRCGTDRSASWPGLASTDSSADRSPSSRPQCITH